MEVWKTIPSWFKLSNYDDCASFTSAQWLNELSMRLIYIQRKHFENGAPTSDSRQLVDHIKTNGLVSKMKPYSYSKDLKELLRQPENTYQENRASVRNLSQRTAYGFFLDANNKEEIEYDYSVMSDTSTESVWGRLEERKAASSRLSHPIINTQDYYSSEGTAFLEINLAASDEQLLKEFKDWLNDARCDESFVKRQFSKADFEGWHTSRILPYWDLTSIAALENATIPFHILGEALFPDEFGVDLTDRVRKVTKKKSQFVGAGVVIDTLEVQVESEKKQRNTS